MKKGVFHCVKFTNQLSSKTYFQKVDQHTGGKCMPWHEAPPGQSVAKPGTPL